MTSPSSSAVHLSDPPTLSPHPLYANITSTTLSPTLTLHNIAGQVAIPDPIYGTTSTPATLSEQIDICLSRISLCLDHLGAKKTDIAVFKYFVVECFYDYEDDKGLKLVGGKAGEWLEGHRPASTLLVVKGLSQKDFACEFEATVYLKKG